MTDSNRMFVVKDLLNVTVIGDGTAGINHMLITYTENRFPQYYCPTIVDNPVCNILIDGAMVRLKLCPVPGMCSLFFL